MLRIPLRSVTSATDARELPHTYTKKESKTLTANRSSFICILPILFFLFATVVVLILYFYLLASQSTPLDGPSWLYSSSNSIDPSIGSKDRPVHIVLPTLTRTKTTSPVTKENDDSDPIDDARDTRHWFEELLDVRQALDALSLDLTDRFPPPPPPEPIPLHQRGRQRSFTWPQTPAIPRSAWSAGLPDYRALFTRDTVIALLLNFPWLTPTLQASTSWNLEMFDPTSSASSPRPFPFSQLARHHPSTDSSLLADLSHYRDALLVLGHAQGQRIDASNGEEIGKIPHELPGVDLKRRIGKKELMFNTKYASMDSTAMWMLGVVHYTLASNDYGTFETFIPMLISAYGYLLEHIEPSSGLFKDDPMKYRSSTGGDHSQSGDASSSTPILDALKVTYWKDSALAQRVNGEPASPVAYLLVQSQTLAAVRSFNALYQIMRQYGGKLKSLADTVEAALHRTKESNMEVVIQRLRHGLQRTFFSRSSEETTSDADIPPPSNCPHFGVDSIGVLSRRPTHNAPVTSPSSTPTNDELVTSDPLQALFFLDVDDLTSDELKRWFTPTPTSAPSSTDPSASATSDSPLPWSPSCFESLETRFGYVTSNLDREASSDGIESIFHDPSRRRRHQRAEGANRDPHAPMLTASTTSPMKEIAYHHYSIWPFEQALIHIGARRFQLTHVEKVAKRFFKSFQAQLIQPSSGKSVSPSSSSSSSSSSLSHRRRPLRFPEYFLPRSIVSDMTTVKDDGSHFILRSSEKSSSSATSASPNDWIGSGASIQLWTVGAWNYWINYRHIKHSITNNQATLALSSSSPSPSISVSPCQTSSAHLVRGTRREEHWRYCLGESNSNSEAIGSYPSLVFACRDGSSMVWLTQVNDDYCDCMDGSDEVGTAACSMTTSHSSGSTSPTTGGAQRFTCTNAQHETIPLSQVDDGVCDCCDGSDERDSGVTCKKKC